MTKPKVTKPPDTSARHHFYEPAVFHQQESLSVGIFQWIPAKKGGVKKDNIKYRVRGKITAKSRILARAVEICKQMDAGTWEPDKPGQKSETVK